MFKNVPYNIGDNVLRKVDIRDAILGGVYTRYNSTWYNLQASDMDTYSTSTTNIDRVFIGVDAFSGVYNVSGGSKYFRTPITVPKGAAGVDDTTNIGSHYFASDILQFIVAKRAFADIAAARTYYTGTPVLYQLASAASTQLSMMPVFSKSLKRISYPQDEKAM